MDVITLPCLYYKIAHLLVGKRLGSSVDLKVDFAIGSLFSLNWFGSLYKSYLLVVRLASLLID